MKVTEAGQLPASQYGEAISGNLAVTSAMRKQYLESARGHYLSALAGLNVGKKEQTKSFCNIDACSVLEDNAWEEETVAEETSIQAQLGHTKTFAEVDTQKRHLSRGVWEASETSLQSMKVHLNKTLAISSNEHIPEMVSRIGAFGQDMETVDALELEATRTVCSELHAAKDMPSTGVLEGSSLQRMVKSLKAELENLKREHADLKDVDAVAEFASRNLHFKKSEHEGFRANTLKVTQTFEEAAQVKELKIKNKGLKREHEILKVEVEKRPRVAVYVDETKDATMNSPDQDKSVPRRMYNACVSTSESSARIMNFEDELESSSQNAKSDKPVPAVTGHVESDRFDHASEFSIRDYVFAARSKDICMNWPFSQKNLQLCLKNGVKDLLPPFQPMDYLRDSSMKRCLAQPNLHSEESTFDQRPLVLKNHLVPASPKDHLWTQELAEGYRDSDSFPSVGEKDLGFKPSNSHSEVGSVSTSNLPLSDVSDEREVAASAANNKSKSSASQLSNKKCRVTVKMRISGNAVEDITSACTVPSEAMTSKICPVCESFSSSSNTTLNAHIDQCLSSQSTPNWVKTSKLTKPRIKPRKIRLMADICATAPQCTLEDLDRRNGTNWATNADLPSQDTEMINHAKNCSVSSKDVVNNADDGVVYIDSKGRKIRILSKVNDMSPLTFPKAREDLRPKKQSRKSKTSKFFSPNRKRRLAKHLKYLKVTRQRKRFSSRMVKVRHKQARGVEGATCTAGEKHVEEQQPAPSVQQMMANFPGTSRSRQWISSKRSILSKKKDVIDISKPCRYKVQTTNSLLPVSDQPDTSRTDVKEHSSSPEKSLFPHQRRVRTSAVHRAGTDQRSEGSCGRKTSCDPSRGVAIPQNRDPCLVSLKLGAAQFDGESGDDGVQTLMDGTMPLASAVEREVESQADAGENADSSVPGSEKLSDSSRVGGGRTSNDSEFNMPSHSLRSIHVIESNSKQKSPSLEHSSGGRRVEKRNLWPADTSRQSSAMPHQLKRRETTNSLGCGNLLKLHQKLGLQHGENGSGEDDNRTSGHADDIWGKHGCVKSALTRLSNNRKTVPPDSLSGLGIKETVSGLSRSSNPEPRKVSDVLGPQPESLQCSEKIQNPLFKPEVRLHPSQSTLSDDPEMFYGNVVGAERLEPETRVSDYKVGGESSIQEVDPIPIPGPPGSELPSFSDMGSEGLHRGASLSTSSLARSHRDADDFVDGDLSDSPFSATSTISNLMAEEERTVSEPRVNLPISDEVYPGWFGASAVSMVGTSRMFSLVGAAGTERGTSVIDSSKESASFQDRGALILRGDDQQCCCSRKEGIPWSAASNFQESQPPVQRMGAVLSASAGQHKNPNLSGRPSCSDIRHTSLPFSSCARGESETLDHSFGTSFQSIMPMKITTETAVRFHRADVCDTATPSAPILRLMGKDLMVINKEKDGDARGQVVQNICTNRQVLPVSDFSSGIPRSWEHHSPQSTVFIGPLVHEQDPRAFSVRHFDVGSLNMVNNFTSPKQQSSVGTYADKHKHVGFTVLGAMPPQI